MAHLRISRYAGQLPTRIVGLNPARISIAMLSAKYRVRRSSCVRRQTQNDWRLPVLLTWHRVLRTSDEGRWANFHPSTGAVQTNKPLEQVIREIRRCT